MLKMRKVKNIKIFVNCHNDNSWSICFASKSYNEWIVFDRKLALPSYSAVVEVLENKREELKKLYPDTIIRVIK